MARIAALAVLGDRCNVLVLGVMEVAMEPLAQENALTHQQFEQMLREAAEFETVRRAAYAVLAGPGAELLKTFERRSNPIAAVTEASDRLRDYLLWRETETEMLEAASQALEGLLLRMRRQRRSDYNPPGRHAQL
jgi:hypothetical protein